MIYHVDALFAGRWRRPSWGFYVLGTAGLSLSVFHLFTEGEGFGTALEAFIVAALSVVFFYSGRDLDGRGFSASGEQRTLTMTCLSIFAFALLAVALVFVRRVEHQAVDDLAFMVLFASALGGAFGGRASLYAIQSREERYRIQDLTKLLTVNQRVLRHNLRNELAIALGHLENLEAKADPGDADVRKVRSHLGELLEISETARDIVSIWEDDEVVTFSLRDLVDEATHRFDRNHPQVFLFTDVPEDHAIRGHVDLPAALDEALENAAIHNDGDVEISIESSASVRDGRVEVSIADTGRGVPSGERRALFQPIETPLSHSEGLGLWLIYWAVKKSGGDLRFGTNDPHGTVVELHLPTARRSGRGT